MAKDVEAYKKILIERFSNPQMGDQLSRLCMDGSSKIPKCLIPTVQTLLAEGRSLSRVAMIIASWALYLQCKDEGGQRPGVADTRISRDGGYFWYQACQLRSLSTGI